MYYNYDRFSPDKNWVKILPISDRKIQTTEFVELQSILNYQTQQNFSYLYSLYSVTRGLRLSLIKVGLNSDNHKFLLQGGQVYIETEKGAFFLDIDSQHLEISSTLSRVTIGLKIKFVQSDNEDCFKDIQTGGEIGGSEGASRLLIDYEIVQNTDNYPIALLVNSQNVKPDIHYYQDNQLSQNYSSNIISKYIKDSITRRWYEEFGNFISNGLNLSYNRERKTITVSCGVAYIKGQRIELNFTSYIKLDSITKLTRYLIILNKYGRVSYSINTPQELEENLILGYLDIYNDTYKYDYKVTESKNRRLTVAEIDNLAIEHERTLKEFEQSNLDIQLLRNKNSNTSGIYSDTFNDLSRSDIFNPSFSASFTLRDRLIRPSFVSKTKTISNFKVSSSNLNISLKNLNPYYISPKFTESKGITQDIATNSITLGKEVNSANMSISPNTSYSSDNSLSTSIMHPSYEIGLSYSNIDLSLLSSNDYTNNNQVYVEAYNLKSLEDNFILYFGNSIITDFTLANGTNGSSYSSIKATAAGTISLSFRIPSTVKEGCHVCRLVNNRIEIKTEYNIYNTAKLRVYRPSSLTTNKVNNKYCPVLEGIAQTFTIDSPRVISSINLAIKSISNITNSDIILVSLVKVNYNLPTNDCLGIAKFTSNDITVSNNGTKFSNAKFDKPVILPNSGTYAIVVSTLINSVELFYAQVGNTSLKTGTSLQNNALANSLMMVKENGSWVSHLNRDLTFQLCQAIPDSITSEAIFTVEDTEVYNTVEISLPCITPQGTSIELFYQEGSGNWKLARNNIYTLQTASNSSKFKLRFKGTSSIFPIIEADNFHSYTLKNNTTGTWVSKSTEFENNYSNVEITFDCYKPSNTNIVPKFSSNEGQSWQELTLSSSTLIDGNELLYRVIYKATGLTQAVTFNKQNISRTKFKMKIDFSTTDSTSIPYVKRLSSIVS